jgi:hypothetical protein
MTHQISIEETKTALPFYSKKEAMEKAQSKGGYDIKVREMDHADREGETLFKVTFKVVVHHEG